MCQDFLVVLVDRWVLWGRLGPLILLVPAVQCHPERLQRQELQRHR